MGPGVDPADHGDGAGISVVIPTFNSARTLPRCLDSIEAQSLRPREIVVADGGSTDATLEIARARARIVAQPCGIGEARFLGARLAVGSRIMNLDADQTLRPEALRDAVATGRDVVAFGELSVGRGVIATLNAIDRRRMHRHWEQNLDPVAGTIRPRMYPRALQLRALEKIPAAIRQMSHPSAYSEDSLLYAATGVAPAEVGFVPDSVVHEELESVLAYVRKWNYYGRAAKVYRGTEYERFARRRAARPGGAGDFIAGLPILAVRAVPFAMGYYL